MQIMAPVSPFLVVIPLLMTVVLVSGYGSGNLPDSVCDSMKPSHGGSAQTSASPYTIGVSQTTYTAGASIEVTISGDEFMGFLLEARGGDITYGSFTDLPTNARTHCSDQAASHNSKEEKDSITVTWTAPDPAVGDIVFRATVVEKKSTWWEGVSSDTITESSDTTGAAGNVTEGPTVGTTVAGAATYSCNMITLMVMILGTLPNKWL